MAVELVFAVGWCPAWSLESIPVQYIKIQIALNFTDPAHQAQGMWDRKQLQLVLSITYTGLICDQKHSHPEEHTSREQGVKIQIVNIL